jgi:mRNA-degrading endonuclease toxin of MazEF toxin-antitoxin module
MLVPGDIVWVRINNHVVGGETQKNRLWMVISTPTFNKGPLCVFMGVPLSTKIRLLEFKLPTHMAVMSNQVTYQDKHLPDELKALRVDRVALSGQVRTLSEQRIMARIGNAQMRAVDDARTGVSYNMDRF